MKKIIIILLFSGAIIAQNPWQVIKKPTIGNSADRGFFLNENSGWLFSENSSNKSKGGIYFTNDSGISWTTQRDTSDLSETINDIFFLDTNNGWACGDVGLILYTTDGGSNWIESASVSTNENLEAINFVNSSIGYACGDEGVIIRTNDGGISWILQNSTTDRDLHDIAFFDANNGFAVFGENVTNVLWTNTGGFLWSTSTFTKPAGQINVRMDACDAVTGTNHAWMIGYHGNIFHSTNKGQNWTHVKALYGSDNAYAKAISFYDANFGFAGADDGLVYRTTNGGTSWDSVSVGSGERIQDIYAIDANTIISIGENQQVRKSTDGGNTWIHLIDWPRLDFRSIGIADSAKISLTTFGGDMTFSEDFGLNFSFPGNENLPTSGAILCVEFFDENLGFYGVSGGEIAKSIDGGSSWYKTNVTGVNDLKRIQDIFILDQNVAWAGAGTNRGIHGRVYKTSDSGENWTEVAALEVVIYGIYFLDSQIGYACGENGKIYKCTDGNTAWTEIDTLGDDRLHTIDFIDSNTGYIVGYNGILGKSIDGGNSWDVVDTLAVVNDSTFDELWDIKFVNSTEGWIAAGNAIGGNGAFYYTSDAGNSWQRIESPNGKTIRELELISNNLGWAAGSHGTIFKYDATTGIDKNLSDNTLKSFQLYSNYPNPFNPTTNIKYYINIAGNAELAIYNINGQKIKTIIKEHQFPGNYKFAWDGTNEAGKKVSSGSYFYQLKLDNDIHAKRMILLK
jgi:photosystem II stability/assembly factor-like uncharacterized protein